MTIIATLCPHGRTVGQEICQECVDQRATQAAHETALALTKTDLVTVVTSGATDEDLEAFVAQLPELMLAPAIIHLGELRRQIARVEKALEVRYGRLPLARELYVDPTTTHRYAWMSGSRANIVKDVGALFDELHAKGVSLRSLGEAVSARGLKVTVLERIAVERDGAAAGPAHDIIREYVERKEGPSHLRDLDQKEDE